jgi:two-component system response regulator NreC
MTDSIRIILADDHEILREGLRGILRQHRDIEIVAEAANGTETVALTRQFSPDIVIMDITMPDLNGIEATRQIIRDIPGVRVIALSMHSDRHFIERMLHVGASGYLLKHCASRELMTAIRTVQSGKHYLSQTITEVTLAEILTKDGEPVPPLLTLLTAKEREVLQMVAEGHPTKLIADKMHVTENTVEKHRQHIMDKLGIHSIAELTKYAIREGITSLDR